MARWVEIPLDSPADQLVWLQKDAADRDPCHFNDIHRHKSRMFRAFSLNLNFLHTSPSLLLSLFITQELEARGRNHTFLRIL